MKTNDNGRKKPQNNPPEKGGENPPKTPLKRGGKTPLKTQKNGVDDCIFCKIISGEIPCTKVYEDEHTLAFLDIHPMSPGHTLVIPKVHYKGIKDCPDEVMTQLLHTIKIVARDMQCFKVAQNNERPLQEVFHLHFHVIPY